MLRDEAIRLGSRQEQNHELIASSDQGTVKFAGCVMYALIHTSNAPGYRGYRLPVEPRDGGEGNLGLRACLQPHSPDDGTSGTQRTMPAPGTEFQAHRAATDRVGASSLRQPNRCHARYPVRAHRPTARGQAPGQNRATGGEATTKTLPITHQTTCPCSRERSLTRASEKGQVSTIHFIPAHFIFLVHPADRGRMTLIQYTGLAFLRCRDAARLRHRGRRMSLRQRCRCQSQHPAQEAFEIGRVRRAVYGAIRQSGNARDLLHGRNRQDRVEPHHVLPCALRR